MSAVAIQQMADRVAGLLDERLQIGGRDLRAKLARGGRQLPRRVREAAVQLALAAEKAKNPKLLGQIDMTAVADNYDLCLRHLMTVDPRSRRKAYFASIARSVGFGVVTLALAITGLLAWRGDL